MNVFCMYAAGAWGMLSVISFSEGEPEAGVFKAVVSIALIALAAIQL